MIEYLDRLTPSAAAALQSAWRLSIREGLPVAIDAEHLVYGVIDVSDDLVGAVIAPFTDATHVQSRMRQCLRQRGTASEDGADEDTRLTDRAKEVLALAAEEALLMGEQRIAPIHLLVGAAHVLGREAVNATVKQLRERIAFEQAKEARHG